MESRDSIVQGHGHVGLLSDPISMSTLNGAQTTSNTGQSKK